MSTWDLRNGHIDYNDVGPAAVGNLNNNLRVIGTISTTNGTAGAVEQQVFSRNTPQIYGAFGDGVHDDTAAIQAAINSGAQVFIPEGIYLITSTLLIDDRHGTTIEGAGIRGLNNGGTFLGTQLTWAGNNTDPAIKIFGSSYTTIKNLKIKANSAFPLDTGIRFETKSARVNTHNDVYNVYVSGDGFLGTLHYAIRFVPGTGGDANNDQSLFEHLTIGGYDTVGVDFNMHQTCDHTFNHLIMGSGLGTASVGIKSLEGASYIVNGGGGGGHSEADFRMEGSFVPTIINYWHSENSKRFLVCYVDTFPSVPFNISHPVMLNGCSINNLTAAFASDGHAIEFYEQGPLIINGFSIFTDSSKASAIHFNATGLDTYNFSITGAKIYSSLTNPFTLFQPTFANSIEVVGAGFNIMRSKVVPGEVTLTYGPSIATDAGLGNSFKITASNGTAFTIANPTNAVIGQRILYCIRNTSGGALGTVTWTSFKMSAWVSPATGNNRSIEFRFDGINWVETSRTTSDVPT